MSQKNTSVARRWVEAYNRRDIESLLALTCVGFQMRSIFASIDSEGVFQAPERFPDAYFEVLSDAYESFQVVPTGDFIEVGERVLFPADAEWRGKASGTEGKTPIFVVFWLRDGKVLREETFTDRTEALEAVGLPG